MSSNASLDRVHTFADLKNLIEVSTPKVTFWGGRYVTFYVQKQKYQISLDELSKQVIQIASQRLALNSEECAYANTVARKVRALWDRCDQMIQKKNWIAQFFFKNQNAPDLSFLDRKCNIQSQDEILLSRSSQAITASSIRGTDLWIGSSVATGDVNGDAIQDTIIGAVDMISGNFSIYIVFNDGSLRNIYNLNTITNPNGVIFNGQLFADEVAYKSLVYIPPIIQIASADINGDNKDDIVIGITNVDFIPTVYVVFGNEQLENINNLSDLKPPTGIIINTNISMQLYPAGAPSVAVGDINGDGRADIAIGTISQVDTLTASSKVIVIFGSKNPVSINGFSNITSTSGIFIQLANPGYSVHSDLSFGDVNGDKVDDLAITTWGGITAPVYVVLGNSHIESIQNITALTPPAGFNITGICNGEQPTEQPRVKIGDINGDNNGDLIVGCGDLNFASIVFGKSNPPNVNAQNMSLATGIQVHGGTVPRGSWGYGLGASIATGDVNGDGINDLILGSYNGASVYAIFGNANISTIFNINSIPPNIGIVFNSSICFLDSLFYSPLTTGDINHDGTDDIIIGSFFPGASNLTAQQGYVYEVLGGANLTSVSDYNNLISDQGRTITGALTTSGLQICNNDCPYICPPQPITYTPINAPKTTMITTTFPPSTSTPTVSNTSSPSFTPFPNPSPLGPLSFALLISFTSCGTLVLFAVFGVLLYRRCHRKYRIDDEEMGECTPLLQKNSEIIRINQDFQLAESYKASIALTPGAKLENLLKAEQSYKRGIERGDKDCIYALPQLYYLIGQTYEKLGEDRNSEDYYKRSIDGGYRFAIPALKKLFHTKNRLIDSYFRDLFTCHERANLAYLAEQDRDDGLALHHLQKAEEVDPDHWPIFHLAAAYDCERVLRKLIRESNDISSLLKTLNQQDQKALDIAYIQESSYAIRTLTHEEERCEHQVQNEAHFQKLLTELRDRSSQDFELLCSEELLLKEAQELKDRIKSITEDHVIPRINQEITEYLSQCRDILTMGKMIKAISGLLQKCKIPALFLENKELKNRYAIEKSCREMEAISKELKKFIKTTPNCPPQIVHRLKEIIKYYEKFLQEISTLSSLKEQKAAFDLPAVLNTIEFQNRILKRESFRYLMTQRRDNQYGLHTLREYQGVHYKKDPYAPGIEYMVNSLAQVVVGRGTPPTELLKITIGDKGHIFQASKTVEGINLEYLLLSHPELVKKIDLKNFSEMIALSLLIDPQDGKSDNLMVKLIGNPQGELESLKIISIDNDIAFADPVIKDDKRTDKDLHYVNVKNVLYFLPQMDKPIHGSLRKKFLSTSPEVMLICWLELLAKKNKEYEQLITDGVLSQDELNKFKLPILLVPGFIDSLRNKIRVMQKALKDYPNLTHKEWFRIVEPILERYYEEIQNKAPDPVSATKLLYDEKRPHIEELLDTRIHIDPQHRLMSVLPHHQAQLRDFERKRSESIQIEMERFITKINLSEIKERGQESIIAYIQNLFLIENLSLTNDSLLKLVSLQEFVKKFPKLKSLSLENCHCLNEEDLLCALTEHSDLVLRLGYCKMISDTKSWKRINDSCKNFTIVIRGVEFNISHSSPAELLEKYRKMQINAPKFYDFLLQLNNSSLSSSPSSPFMRKTNSYAMRVPT